MGWAAAFAILVLILAAEAAGAHVQNAFAANTLTVNDLGLDGMPLGMWIVIRSSGAMVKSGLTPLTFAGNHGDSYAMAVFDYGGRAFDHWDNGSTARARTATLSGGRAVTAYFKVPTLAIDPTSGIGGTPVTATGNCFSLGSSMTVTYDGTNVATATTNSAGSFSTMFAAPPRGAGTYAVQATDGRGWQAGSFLLEEWPRVKNHPYRAYFPALYVIPPACKHAG